MPDENESQLDTGHDYDGIRELDNHLPNWWLATLLIAMVFGYGYWLYYQVMRHDSAQMTQYRAELDEAAAAAAARAKLAGAITDEALLAMAGSPTVVAKGEALFQRSCVACHGMQGQGGIGPNLTDDYWLHGGKPTDILHTISNGVPAKGMPTWLPALGEDNVEAAAVFILTLKGKHVPGKAPQGELLAAGASGHP